MPLLSLCLIVRDEAAMLPDFLVATADLRDEFVAVDTGSADATPRLLREAGAIVRHHAWRDDFAAARNASLAAATGDWILILDADERPTPELARQLRDLLRDDTVGAATFPVRNRLPHGHVQESSLLRLWRRDPEIAFRHRIHEDASASVMDALARHGRRLVHLSAPCEHLGYVRDVAAGRAKKQRDLALLTACIAEDPDDWYSRYKLLELARFWDDRALWRDTARQVAARLEGPPPASPPPQPWTGELVALTAIGLTDDPAERLAWLDRWESRVPPSPAFHLTRGLALERTGDLDRARRDYERCRDLPAGTLPMNTTVRPLLGLCRVAAARGDLRTARDLVHQALAHNPRDPEALLAAVSFAWLAGGATARDAWVAEHRRLHGDSEELALARGEHALQAGLWSDAEAALREAAGEPPAGRAALLLAQGLLALGRAGEARDLCRDLAPGLPAAAVGHLACRLALGEAPVLPLELDQAAADRALRAWVGVLWRSRRTDLMTTFVDGHALVARDFPWLTGFLTEATQNLASRTGPGRPG